MLGDEVRFLLYYMAIKITSVYSDIIDKSINQKLANGEL
jgi:hypothetical protein